MKFGMIRVATAILVAGFLSSPADAAEPIAATGAEASCLAALNVSGRSVMTPETRTVTLGPIQWHDVYNSSTGTYQNSGRTTSLGATIKGFGIGVTYRDATLGGVCPGYKTAVDGLIQNLNLDAR